MPSIAKSSAGETAMSDLLDSLDSGSEAPVQAGRKRPRGRIQADLGETVEAEEYKRCKAKVIKAIRESADVARKLAFLLDSGRLNHSKRKNGNEYMLPPCVNKYVLISKERLVMLLTHLEPLLDAAVLELVKHED